VSDEYSLTVRREIAATADVLFDAWLDARSLGSWLRPAGSRETRAETDPQPGGAFRIVMVTDETTIAHSGTYLEIDRPHRLVFTWSSPATGFRDSVVTVTFEPLSDGSTRVEIHQVGLPDADAQTSHEAGWTDALRELGRVHDTTPG
jgi:uncharacterized protein YndB with AHSA1/START domain